MKPNRQITHRSMNKTIALALAVLALSGCNTGDIQVSGSGSNAGPASQLPGQALTPQPTESSGTSASPGSSKDEDRIVFFQRVTLDDGIPDQLSSVSYTSKNASQSSFSEFRFPIRSSIRLLP